MAQGYHTLSKRQRRLFRVKSSSISPKEGCLFGVVYEPKTHCSSNSETALACHKYIYKRSLTGWAFGRVHGGQQLIAELLKFKDYQPQSQLKKSRYIMNIRWQQDKKSRMHHMPPFLFTLNAGISNSKNAKQIKSYTMSSTRNRNEDSPVPTCQN